MSGPAKRPLSQKQRKLLKENLYQKGCQRLQRLVQETGDKPPFQQVLEELASQPGGSDITYGTLRNRYLGMKPQARAHQHQQLLSSEQEDVLVEWILFYSSRSEPIKKRTLRALVERIGRKKPSRNWTLKFLQRHHEVKLGKPSGLDPKRAQGFNKPAVTGFFKELREIVEKHGIPPENIYNMDEKGCQRGGGRKVSLEKCFVCRGNRPAYKVKSANMELTTAIECVAADGIALDPGFVFPGKGYHEEWFEDYPNICVCVSENGWTDDYLCTEWFVRCFLPQVKKRNTSGKPILLIVDGHGSHATLLLISLAQKHGIIILCLPPHTTHKLQPLDVGVFGPFARAWLDRCYDITEETGSEMPIETFVDEYMKVRTKSITESLVKKAWKNSGLYPINQDVFNDNDYGPSSLTSYTTRCVPPSFPSNVIDPLLCIMPIRQKGQQETVDDDSDSDGDNESGNERDGNGREEDGNGLGHEEDGSDHAASADLMTPNNHAVVIPPMPTLSTQNEPPRTPASESAASSEMHTPSFTELVASLSPLRADMPETIDALKARVLELQSDNARLTAHCALSEFELQKKTRRLNAHETRPAKKRKVNAPDTRCLTSSQFVVYLEQENEARRAKEQEKEARQEARAAKENEASQQRLTRDPNTPFSGSLASKKKEELKTLAHSLGLSLAGTVKQLHDRITNHFDVDPGLRNNPKYSGLFTRSRARRANDQNNVENTPPLPDPFQPFAAGPSTSTSTSRMPMAPLPLPQTTYTHFNPLFMPTSSLQTWPLPLPPS